MRIHASYFFVIAIVLVSIISFHHVIAMDKQADNQLIINFMKGDQHTKIRAHFPDIQTNPGAPSLAQLSRAKGGTANNR